MLLVAKEIDREALSSHKSQKKKHLLLQCENIYIKCCDTNYLDHNFHFSLFANPCNVTPAQSLIDQRGYITRQTAFTSDSLVVSTTLAFLF
jgi:hypothetical protein